MQKRLFTLVVMLTAIFASALAQVTTSGISGKGLSAGDDVIGATVTATHKPSATSATSCVVVPASSRAASRLYG